MKSSSVFAAIALLAAVASCAPKQEVAIVAHRGFWKSEAAGKAHNSIASLSEAQRFGFWGSEFDVNMTKDGQLLVFHDGQVDGMPFIEHDAADFAEIRLTNGEPIPTLDQYLDQFAKDKKCHLVFELKTHPAEFEETAVDKCIAALKAHGLFDPKQVMFISFSRQECIYFAQKCPGFTVQYLESDLTPDEVKADGISGIDLHYKTFYEHPEWVEQAHKNGMSVNAWTVNKEEDMRKMIEMGVDFITTNEPERARALLKEMGVKERKAGEAYK